MQTLELCAPIDDVRCSPSCARLCTEDGLAKVKAGVTSLPEVLRVLGSSA